jgi:hypothetical protein
LTIQWNAQGKGDEIRELKAAKAEKDAIMPLVGQLNVGTSRMKQGWLLLLWPTHVDQHSLD